MDALGSNSCGQQVMMFLMGILGALGLLGMFGLDQPDDPFNPPATDFFYSSPTPFFEEATPIFIDPATPTPTAIPTSGGTAEPGANLGEIFIGGGEAWEYFGVEGEVLTIEVRADNPANEASSEERIEQGLLDTYVNVYAPDGRLIASGDDIDPGILTDTQISELVLDEDGVYTIEVRSWSDLNGGTYTLYIKSSESDAEGAPTFTPAPTETVPPTPTFVPSPTARP